MRRTAKPGRVVWVVVALGLCLWASATTSADDWPQWRGPKRDGVWRETGIVEKFDTPQLGLVWRAEISSGYSGPTVAAGRVYVTDRVVKPAQVERVHCFDSKTGKNLWTHTYDCPYEGVGYDAGPRASVTIDDGRAYSLGAMGHLFCFDAAKGDILWKKDLNKEYNIQMPQWGIAASPLIEGDLLIIQVGGADEACLVAFDRKTGQERWRALKDRAGYSAPIVLERAGKRILICYTGDNVVGLDPQTGKVHWQYPFPPRQMVIGISTPVVSADKLFLTNFFDGSLMLKLDHDKPGVEKLWQRAGESEKNTDALHSIITTPLFEGDYIYGVDSYGELRCLDARTGDRIWESLDAVPKARWATIHFVRNGEHVWMFNERGELIIADLSPKGYQEISRTKLLEPTLDQLRQRGGVCWSHPAFADKHVFARNDKELVCADLAAR
jgi:outer membrane protein assembly factor BamB